MRNLFLFFVMTIAACNNNASTSTASDTAQSSQTIHNNIGDTVVTSATPVNLNGCYQMVLQRDTATLQLQVQDSTVTGNLDYDFYEKDSNHGTLRGVLRGDVIDAEYTFNSEGTSSVREVVFKIQDSVLVEGFGDISEDNGKLHFKDRDNLQYQTGHPFRKIVCP